VLHHVNRINTLITLPICSTEKKNLLEIHKGGNFSRTYTNKLYPARVITSLVYFTIYRLILRLLTRSQKMLT